MKKNVILITSITAVTALGIGGVALGVNALTPQTSSSVSVVSPSPAASVAPSASSSTSSNTVATKSTAELLAYLIEEEKLAHDVYTVLAQKWGANTFTNILSSEVSHQSQVAGLLPTYGVADPRSSQLGVFTNAELQALYNKLIAQGSISVTEAYKVGIAIEEMDIQDLKDDMALVTDQKVLSVMQTLLDGSYNHLAAFQKKL